MLSGQPTAFFGKTYDETLGLLVEVRDYVADGELRDRAALAPAVGARLSCEALRVTARLTQLMAWLLAQKAVHAGELSNEEVIRRNDPWRRSPSAWQRTRGATPPCCRLSSAPCSSAAAGSISASPASTK